MYWAVVGASERQREEWSLKSLGAEGHGQGPGAAGPCTAVLNGERRPLLPKSLRVSWKERGWREKGVSILAPPAMWANLACI